LRRMSIGKMVNYIVTIPARESSLHILRNNIMQTISHILSLPVDQSTLDFALVCAAIVAIRVGLSIIFHKLAK
jgi:hypothetical protein